jgi:hypothetical protein
MRMSIQLREPLEGRRWIRSVYLDQSPRTVSIPVSELSPVEPHSGRHAALDAIDSVLAVVDTTNASPGTSALVWLGDLNVEKVGSQVRTVSSR